MYEPTVGTMIAYYLIVQLGLGSPCPVLYGPYTHGQCLDMQEWLVSRGYEKGDCALLPIPQEAQDLQIGYLP